MTWLTEDPTTVIVLGSMTIALLAIVFYKTGRAPVLFGLLGAIFIVGALVLVEHLVVTDRERVELTIYGVADALEADDLARVQSYLTADALQLQNRATRYFSIVEVQEAKITDGPHITINKLTPTAHVELVAVPSWKMKYDATIRKIPFDVKVDLRLEGERWLIDAAEVTPFDPSNR
jgi:ABC-type uncharacterized transport system permease subunit